MPGILLDTEDIEIAVKQHTHTHTQNVNRVKGSYVLHTKRVPLKEYLLNNIVFISNLLMKGIEYIKEVFMFFENLEAKNDLKLRIQSFNKRSI